jgi:hypothetical protein
VTPWGWMQQAPQKCRHLQVYQSTQCHIQQDQNHQFMIMTYDASIPLTVCSQTLKLQHLPSFMRVSQNRNICQAWFLEFSHFLCLSKTSKILPKKIWNFILKEVVIFSLYGVIYQKDKIQSIHWHLHSLSI